MLATLGDTYGQMGDAAKALAHYSKVLELAPTNESALYKCALLYLGNSDTDGYRTAAEKVVGQLEKAQPGPNVHLLHWACVLAPNAVTNYSPVLEAAGRAVAAQVTSADALDDFQNLGALLYRADRYTDAVQQLTEAYEVGQQIEANASRTSPAYGAYFLAMTHARQYR